MREPISGCRFDRRTEIAAHQALAVEVAQKYAQHAAATANAVGLEVRTSLGHKSAQHDRRERVEILEPNALQIRLKRPEMVAVLFKRGLAEPSLLAEIWEKSWHPIYERLVRNPPARPTDKSRYQQAQHLLDRAAHLPGQPGPGWPNRPAIIRPKSISGYVAARVPMSSRCSVPNVLPPHLTGGHITTTTFAVPCSNARAVPFGFIRGCSSSPATITLPCGPVPPAAAMRRGKSSAKFNTYGTRSLPRGRFAMSTSSTRSFGAGATKSRISAAIPNTPIRPSRRSSRRSSRDSSRCPRIRSTPP